jgi:hypothetical protein
MEGMKLHFVWADTWRNRMAIIHENESFPYQKRVVTVELTPEQLETIQPQRVGQEGLQPQYEEFYEVIAEPCFEKGGGKDA